MNHNFPDYIDFPKGATDMSVSETVYRFLHIAANPNEWMQFPEILGRFVPSREGHTIHERIEKWEKIVHSEFLDMSQLVDNIKDPIGQWAHTAHSMYKLPTGIWVVDHYFMQKKGNCRFCTGKARRELSWKGGQQMGTV
jgi:hypothetical protein